MRTSRNALPLGYRYPMLCRFDADWHSYGGISRQSPYRLVA
jgi:hypothetical protein